MKQGLHHQQLFHWIGRNIEIDLPAHPTRKQQEDANRAYIGHLRGSIENGLWLKSTEPAESLRNGTTHIKLDRPITCFTEWSLRDSTPHTRKYGRLGFGFARNWVVARGGQPVTYVGTQKNCPYTVAATELHAALQADQTPAHDLLNHLLTVLHYSRALREPSKKSGETETRSTTQPKRKTKQTTDKFHRSWPLAMPLVEEREWRIVHTNGMKKCVANPEFPKSGPQYFLPYKTGKELFTLVVPNNEILQQVANAKWFRKHLFPSDRPHVSLLSWQDLGSF